LCFFVVQGEREYVRVDERRTHVVYVKCYLTLGSYSHDCHHNDGSKPWIKVSELASESSHTATSLLNHAIPLNL